jgi:hypothetical protein
MVLDDDEELEEEADLSQEPRRPRVDAAVAPNTVLVTVCIDKEVLEGSIEACMDAEGSEEVAASPPRQRRRLDSRPRADAVVALLGLAASPPRQRRRLDSRPRADAVVAPKTVFVTVCVNEEVLEGNVAACIDVPEQEPEDPAPPAVGGGGGGAPTSTRRSGRKNIGRKHTDRQMAAFTTVLGNLGSDDKKMFMELVLERCDALKEHPEIKQLARDYDVDVGTLADDALNWAGWDPKFLEFETQEGLRSLSRFVERYRAEGEAPLPENGHPKPILPKKQARVRSPPAALQKPSPAMAATVSEQPSHSCTKCLSST